MLVMVKHSLSTVTGSTVLRTELMPGHATGIKSALHQVKSVQRFNDTNSERKP